MTDYNGLVERLHTPEFEAARIALCHFWLAIADDPHEGGVRYPELGRKAIETEQALTLYGNAMPEAADAIKRLTAELAEAKTACERYAKAYEVTQVQADEAKAALAEARKVMRPFEPKAKMLDAYPRDANCVLKFWIDGVEHMTPGPKWSAFCEVAAWLERNK